MSLAKASPSSIPLNVGQHVCAVLRFFSKSMPKNLIQKRWKFFFSFLKTFILERNLAARVLKWKPVLIFCCPNGHQYQG